MNRYYYYYYYFKSTLKECESEDDKGMNRYYYYYYHHYFKSTLKECESEDEGVNRSASVLATLAHITLSSPICEKRAIAMLFQATKEQFLDEDLVRKVCSGFDSYSDI